MWTLKLSQYQFANWDVSSDPIYVGFVDKDGKWYIKEFNIANGTAKIAIGGSAYSTNWTGRTGLTYDYFNAVV